MVFFTCTGLSPSKVGFSKTVPLLNTSLYRSPATPVMPKQNRFRLFPFRSPLLGESLLFYFPVGNEMFQFPTFAFHLHGISVNWRMGCPIRVSADGFVFANTRSLSQLVTPFFASESQGILRTPLVTFFSRILVLILFISLLVSSYFLWFDSLCNNLHYYTFPNMPKNFKKKPPLTPPKEGDRKTIFP